jgi:hypothetical protein
MDNAAPISLPQTLGLLDCAEAVRPPMPSLASVLASPPPVKEPAVLKEHLLNVCQSLGQPLTTTDADKAVTLYLHKEAGLAVTPSAILGDRPTSEQDWQRRRAQAEEHIAQAQATLSRWKTWVPIIKNLSQLIIVLGLCVGSLGGLFKLLIVTNPGGPADQWPVGLMSLACGALAGLALFAESKKWFTAPLARAEEALQGWKKRSKGLTALAVDNRPGQSTLSGWTRIPGVTAAFYQIHVSGVPFLEQDLQAFKRQQEAYEHSLHHRREMEAEERRHEEARRRDQEWTKGFERLALSSLDQSPQPTLAHRAS